MQISAPQIKLRPLSGSLCSMNSIRLSIDGSLRHLMRYRRIAHLALLRRRHRVYFLFLLLLEVLDWSDFQRNAAASIESRRCKSHLKPARLHDLKHDPFAVHSYTSIPCKSLVIADLCMEALGYPFGALI